MKTTQEIPVNPVPRKERDSCGRSAWKIAKNSAHRVRTSVGKQGEKETKYYSLGSVDEQVLPETQNGLSLWPWCEQWENSDFVTLVITACWHNMQDSCTVGKNPCVNHKYCPYWPEVVPSDSRGTEEGHTRDLVPHRRTSHQGTIEGNADCICREEHSERWTGSLGREPVQVHAGGCQWLRKEAGPPASKR